MLNQMTLQNMSVYYISRSMSNHFNCFDLPLQRNYSSTKSLQGGNPFEKQITCLPKQMYLDQYRKPYRQILSSKKKLCLNLDERPKLQIYPEETSISNTKNQINQKKNTQIILVQTPFSQNKQNKKHSQNSLNLKLLITNKLQETSVKKYPKTIKIQRQKQYNSDCKQTKYQLLLKEVYGNPQDFKAIPKTLMHCYFSNMQKNTSKKENQQKLKRCQSQIFRREIHTMQGLEVNTEGMLMISNRTNGVNAKQTYMKKYLGSMKKLY